MDIIIYGADWCKDCRRTKEFLEERNIPYEVRDITDPEKGEEYSEYVMEKNDGKRIIPSLEIGENWYANPRPAELTNILSELVSSEGDEEGLTKCSQGKILQDGDSVILTRDLDVKGSQLNLKQGNQIDKIKLTGNPDYVDARIGKSTIAIKTKFLKKR